MRLVKRMGYASVSPSQLFEREGRSLAITFDDGYENFHQNALPVLEFFGLSATVFLVSGLIGGTDEWDREKGTAREKLMDWQQILDAKSRGAAFGSHSVHHPDLSKCGDAEVRQEVFESREQLAEGLGEAPSDFCYPYGAHTDSVKQIVRDAGYKTACSTLKGGNFSGADPYALRRINVRTHTGTLRLWQKLRHAERHA